MMNLGLTILFVFIFILLWALYVPDKRRIKIDEKIQKKIDVQWKKNVSLDDELYYIDYDVNDQYIRTGNGLELPNLENIPSIDNFSSTIERQTILDNEPNIVESYMDFNEFRKGAEDRISQKGEKIEMIDNRKLEEIMEIGEEDYKNPRIRDVIEKKYYESKRYEYNMLNLENLME
jgi:hypothetical protein